jgi:hypothetical protein
MVQNCDIMSQFCTSKWYLFDILPYNANQDSEIFVLASLAKK